MKNNKIMRTIIGLTLLVALLVPVTALAANPGDHFYNFKFTDRVNHQEPHYEKGDTEQRWYFTLYNTGKSNVSSTNILGVKMNRTYNNYVDVYRTYTRSTNNKAIDYLSYVNNDDIMFLGAKKDSDSTSYATLYANGAYNP